MPELNLHDIDQISRDISRQEITFSHLLEELIDHVCCDVEYEMYQGSDFTDAYRKVKERIGSRGLEKVQEETLYAVDTKYRKMKNTMKISGVAGTVLLGFAAMFKIQHWPGGGSMLILGALILAFVFLPSALVVLWKETRSTKRIFLFISSFLTGICFISGTIFKIQHWPYAGYILIIGALSGILFFIPALLINRLNDLENKFKRPAYILGATGSVLFIAGLLFKIQHWPYATLFIITGMILLVLLALPLYTWLTWKEENHISPTFIFMIIGSLLIIMPGALITLNLQHSYQEYYYPNNYQQDELFNYLLRNNSSLLSSYQNSPSYPQMDRLHTRTTGLLAIISNIQERMVRESEGEPGIPAVSTDQIKQTKTGPEIIYRQLSKPLDTRPVKDFLLPGCSSRNELDSSLAEYGNFLTSMIPAEDLVKYKKVLDTETLLPREKSEENEISLMSGLHSLEIMKNGLLTVESSVLNGIAQHK